ncbi:MAG: histidine kinase [Anaerolineae bacterium]
MVQQFNAPPIVRRALVYGALMACVVSLYGLVVGIIGAMLVDLGLVVTGPGGIELPSAFLLQVAAAGVVAVAFQPLREGLQQGVDQLLYGQRAEPYKAIETLAQRLGSAYEPADVLPTLVQTVSEALKLPYTAITLRQGDTEQIVARAGEPIGQPVRFPLVYQGQSLGALLASPRRAEAALSADDCRLLSTLASQASVAVHGVSLMRDLQVSRERIIAAREEERRRLRRDLHDDLAPTLAGLSMTAGSIAEFVLDNPGRAVQLADELHEAMRDTVGHVRRLAYDLRPPVLDDLGLVAAISERAALYSRHSEAGGVQVTVDVPNPLPPLPAAVEVAAYRVVQEALMNVMKHAQADCARVRLVIEGLSVVRADDPLSRPRLLIVEVEDDGVGLVPPVQQGLGLRTMRERVTELGGTLDVAEYGDTGGTHIRACLPIGMESSDEQDSRPYRG